MYKLTAVQIFRAKNKGCKCSKNPTPAKIKAQCLALTINVLLIINRLKGGIGKDQNTQPWDSPDK